METYYKVYINDSDCDICVSDKVEFLAAACSHYNWLYGMIECAGHINQYVTYSGISKLVSSYDHNSIMHILNNTELTDELGYYYISGDNHRLAAELKHYSCFYSAFCVYQSMVEVDPTCEGIRRVIAGRTYECAIPEIHGLYEGQPLELMHTIAEHTRFLHSRIEDEILELRDVDGSNAAIDNLEAIIDSCRPELDCVDAHEEFMCKYGYDGEEVI